MLQDLTGKLGAALGVASNVTIDGVAKYAKVAGKISTAITVGNIGYEIFTKKPYINEITSKLFWGYYESESFDLTVERFLAYTTITQELIDLGIITYTTSWGIVDDYKVDWDRYKEYFEELGICAKDIGEMIK